MPPSATSRSRWAVCVCAAAALAACRSGRPSPAAAAEPRCEAQPGYTLARAANFAADRRGENRYRLPWAGDAPPAIVTDEAVCAGAADALAAHLGRAVDAVGLVSVGGLYLADPSPPVPLGEFGVTYLLDRQFRVVRAFAG